MARYAYVNGRYVDHRDAKVHVEDRGYQLADGVYEVVGVRDGKLIDEKLHIDRLGRSLGELRIGWPVARPTLGFIMRELMRRNRLRDGLVYMQVTRFGGNISRTATFVGMERSALHRKLKSLGLHGGAAESGGEAALETRGA